MVTGMAEYIEREAGIKAIENDLPEQVHYSREIDNFDFSNAECAAGFHFFQHS